MQGQLTVGGNVLIEVSSDQMSKLGTFTVVTLGGAELKLSMADLSAMLYLTDHGHIHVDDPVYCLVQHSHSYRTLFAEVVIKGKPAVALSADGGQVLEYLFGSPAIRSYRNLLYPQIIPVAQQRGR